MQIVPIILAGGDGQRFGMSKQFISVKGKPVFIHTLSKFVDQTSILTIPSVYKDLVVENIKSFGGEEMLKNVYVVSGGSSRQESIYNALSFILDNKIECDGVLITDANRPCITKETFSLFMKEMEKYPAIVAACKSINTPCSSKDGMILDGNINRSFLYDLLMPQCFWFQKLYNAHKNFTNKEVTDDTVVLRSLYPDIEIRIIQISFWEGLKLTKPEDYKIFELLLEKQ